MYVIPSGWMGVSPIPRKRFPSKTYIHMEEPASFSHPGNITRETTMMRFSEVFDTECTGPKILLVWENQCENYQKRLVGCGMAI